MLSNVSYLSLNKFLFCLFFCFFSHAYLLPVTHMVNIDVYQTRRLLKLVLGFQLSDCMKCLCKRSALSLLGDSLQRSPRHSAANNTSACSLLPSDLRAFLHTYDQTLCIRDTCLRWLSVASFFNQTLSY